MDGRAYWCEQCRHIFRLRVSRGLCPHCNTSSIKRYDNDEEEDYHRSSGILHSFFKLFGSPSESAAAAGDASNPYYPDFAMPLARWLFGEGPNPYPEHRVPPPRSLIDRSRGKQWHIH
ncbi:hypothetical protein Nepgr_031280 [Nepenthes gracilis]|uniref:Uncharacterized protein n=1 Tax=Nepenthes gracilis TaxID=150966 RepID=A0AAD3TH89_NEPGR|nr:hypothetical protein Nepgr_031280 [Nepenthes gracilis]